MTACPNPEIRKKMHDIHASIFKKDNPRFNPELFKQASKVE